jgi:hypothetical protein
MTLQHSLILWEWHILCLVAKLRTYYERKRKIIEKSIENYIMSEFHNMYSSRYISRLIKSRTVVSVAYVACMEEMRNAYVVSVGKSEERRLRWRLGVAGVMTRKCV